jgi:AAA domain
MKLIDGKLHVSATDLATFSSCHHATALDLGVARGERDKSGTVDKFQGREAPIVIYSMATSTPEEAPRGMDFLYSQNRLNVASSRARCACILVASPRLFEPECRSVEHVRLANSLCKYLQMSQRVELPALGA